MSNILKKKVCQNDHETRHNIVRIKSHSIIIWKYPKHVISSGKMTLKMNYLSKRMAVYFPADTNQSNHCRSIVFTTVTHSLLSIQARLWKDGESCRPSGLLSGTGASEPGRWGGGAVYCCCCSEEVSELGEDDDWLLPLDMLASNISSRRSYTSTAFFLFMLERWSMPLLLQRKRREAHVTHWHQQKVVVVDYCFVASFRNSTWECYRHCCFSVGSSFHGVKYKWLDNCIVEYCLQLSSILWVFSYFVLHVTGKPTFYKHANVIIQT